jgi:threonine/homoserine/homoserine lactone efflux protein
VLPPLAPVSGAFARGVLAGYGIEIPVGAIAVLIVTTAARESFRVGVSAGLGAATADMTYATVAVVAGSALSSELRGIRTSLHAICGRGATDGCAGWVARRVSLGPDGRRAARAGSRPRTYLRFLGLTLINPLTVIYFSSVVVANQTAAGPLRASAFVAGVALASASWQTLLATSGALAGRAVVDRGHLLISVIGYGLVLVLAVGQLRQL